MAKVKGAIVVDNEICKGCEVCIPVCPENVIMMSTDVNRKGWHTQPRAHARREPVQAPDLL